MRKEAISQKPLVRSRNKFPFRIFYPVLFILFFTGCASEKEAIKPSPGYFELLDSMTRIKKVVDKLETKLYIYATYKSLPLREAYIMEYARLYQMDSLEKEKFEITEKKFDEKFNEFFMAVYTPNEKWDDFDSPLSVWKIYMEDDKGDRLAPVEIDKVDVSSPLVRAFYPYLDMWSSGYIVRFPKYTITGGEPLPGADTKFFRLTVTGVVGNATLEWRLK